MRAADELLQARATSGLTIRALAERAGVSPSTVWRIEHGQLNPTVRTMGRLLAAAESRTPEERQTREERVSLVLGRLAASALLHRSEQTREAARRRIASQLVDPGAPRGAKQTLRVWQELLDGPLEDLVQVLIEPSERGHELRSVLPIVGTHSDEERVDAIRRAIDAT